MIQLNFIMVVKLRFIGCFIFAGSILARELLGIWYRKKSKEQTMIRGGFGEPYCSQQCHDQGGKYMASVMLKNQSGVCGICQKPVQASMYGASNCAIVPYEGVNLFICHACTSQGKAFLQNYKKCCMCQKSL